MALHTSRGQWLTDVNTFLEGVPICVGMRRYEYENLDGKVVVRSLHSAPSVVELVVLGDLGDFWWLNEWPVKLVDYARRDPQSQLLSDDRDLRVNRRGEFWVNYDLSEFEPAAPPIFQLA
jgi:hypothetical protein